MKRTAISTVVGLALCCLVLPVGAFAAEAPADSGSAPVGVEAVELATCQASRIQDVPGPSIRKVTLSGLPACPTVSLTCVGGSTSTKCRSTSFCRAGLVTQLIDTGNTSCDQNGTTITCPPGKTIKIKSTPCSQCPCCSQQPACFCPNDCGAITNWSCL